MQEECISFVNYAYDFFFQLSQIPELLQFRNIEFLKTEDDFDKTIAFC